MAVGGVSKCTHYCFYTALCYAVFVLMSCVVVYNLNVVLLVCYVSLCTSAVVLHVFLLPTLCIIVCTTTVAWCQLLATCTVFCLLCMRCHWMRHSTVTVQQLCQRGTVFCLLCMRCHWMSEPPFGEFELGCCAGQHAVWSLWRQAWTSLN